VWKPGPALRRVHPEPLEATLQPMGQRRGPAARIGEDEHSDGARLPVAHGFELERVRRGGFIAQCAQDRVEGAAGLPAEERQRDMEALDGPSRRPPAAEVLLAPPDELRDDVVGKLECEEEPEAVISLDGSRSAHAVV